MSAPTFEQLSELHEQAKTGRITRENLQDFLRNPNHYLDRAVSFPSLTFAADLIPEYKDENGKMRKWEVVEDVQPSMFQVTDLEFVPFLKKGETSVSGAEMRKRAREAGANLGLCDGKSLLERQNEILVVKGNYIAFPGTLLRHPVGDLLVPVLSWFDDSWYPRFFWLGYDWRSGGCLARRK